jgi:hypothetical protein
MSRRIGRSNDLLEVIQTTCKVGELFTADSFDVDDLDRKQIQNGLCFLASKGLIVRGAIKGAYQLPRGSKPRLDDEVVIIDNLLAAMAAAEPILKKYKSAFTIFRS